jgi:ADP-ribosylglycohydrolase
MSLRERWEFENSVWYKGDMKKRITATIFGEIIGGLMNCSPFLNTEKEKLLKYISSSLYLMEKTINNENLKIGESNESSEILIEITPLAFKYIENFNFPELKKEVLKHFNIPYENTASALSCIIYLLILIRLYYFDDLDRSLDITAELCQEYLNNTTYKEYYNDIFNGGIKSLKQDSIFTDNYLVSSLKASLWCFYNSSTYMDAIKNAKSLNGDIIAISFLTGSFAGMHYGIDSMPKEYLNDMFARNDICLLIDKYSQYCTKINLEGGLI